MKKSLLLGLCFSSFTGYGGLNAVDVTNAVVGEAAGCPFIVKLGVAAAIYNPHGALNFGCAADVAKGVFAGQHLTVVLGTGKNATYFFKP